MHDEVIALCEASLVAEHERNILRTQGIDSTLADPWKCQIHSRGGALRFATIKHGTRGCVFKPCGGAPFSPALSSSSGSQVRYWLVSNIDTSTIDWCLRKFLQPHFSSRLTVLFTRALVLRRLHRINIMRYTTIAVLVAATAATVPSLAAPVDMYARCLLVCLTTHPLITASAALLKKPLSPSVTTNMRRSSLVSITLLRRRPVALVNLLSRRQRYLRTGLCSILHPRELLHPHIMHVDAPTMTWRNCSGGWIWVGSSMSLTERRTVGCVLSLWHDVVDSVVRLITLLEMNPCFAVSGCVAPGVSVPMLPCYVR